MNDTTKYNFYPFCGGERYKIVKINDNKIVIKIKTTPNIVDYRAPYNGYVAFPCKDIPKDWLGNYSAGALQYLDIHGGITFCECYLNDIQKNKEYIQKTSKEIRKVKEKDFTKRFEKQQEIRLKANQELGELENSYVVFGFDCAHVYDEENISLRNPDYVMKLVERMEWQLIDYAKIYEEWKEMSRQDQIKAIEKITNNENINELGFGAMIDLLAGGKSFKEKEDKE